jgi:hypothetical protein
MANLVTCNDCGGQVSPRAQACPKCGAPVATATAATAVPGTGTGAATAPATAKAPGLLSTLAWGLPNRKIVCAHCNTVGAVHTKQIEQKKGLSGGKAAGALLTGGLSILATGLSRKERVTQAHCSNCGSTWTF